ncbi:SidA/IucD/PvdA family monooxygenase [Streptomyces sp. NRRL B-1347]|uniref:SidA/IucD/PvdA family monooxygenase n=1 Tax=Streptomyces sp. NRRL B-1347 TaxID=1476877 RepID=UPI0004C9650F|nr:SidA/IucD/PvdA family monooxygenase [Streptomyces sp. NRRL B-1347]
MSAPADPHKPYDVIGIGLGPANLGLACLTEPLDDLTALFLEPGPEGPAVDRCARTPGKGAHLRTPFLADLVTLADPTSPYSFLNYLRESGRLYAFYLRENLYPLRAEYRDYCRWAAARLTSVRFGTTVTEVTYDNGVHAVATSTGGVLRARHLALDTGSTPYVPEVCAKLGGDFVHASRYPEQKTELQKKNQITVVGGGRDAAEVYYDLLTDMDVHGYRLDWVTDAPHLLPPEDSGLLDAILDLLRQKGLAGPVPSRLLTRSTLTGARYEHGRYVLGVRRQERGEDLTLTTEGLVLATGQRYRTPDFLEPVREHVRWDAHGSDPGTAPYRNASIIRELLGREVRPAETSTAFQEFAV